VLFQVRFGFEDRDSLREEKTDSRPHTFNNIVNIRWIDNNIERVRKNIDGWKNKDIFWTSQQDQKHMK